MLNQKFKRKTCYIWLNFRNLWQKLRIGKCNVNRTSTKNRLIISRKELNGSIKVNQVNTLKR